MTSVSRRAFMHTTAAASAAMAFPFGVRVHGSDVIRVGIVGCGGRGTGAARDCMRGAEGVEIVAMGDLMADRLAQSRAELRKAVAGNAALAAKFKVTDERCFTGFDACEKVLASGIDLVILATPPGFRPAHLAAAVAAGKHIFTEKPAAVDAAGVRSVLATCEVARQKNLGIVAGTQRRHQTRYLETIKRLHDGGIGQIVSGQVFWNQGGLWSRDKRAEWSEAEWQIRNWLYFTWLSGDHIVEQHVHNIDVANWVIGAHPVKATGMGGRQHRTEPKYGHIYDHFAVDFEYPNGARVMSMCRQIEGTRGNVGEHFIGSAGRSDASTFIAGAHAWTNPAPDKETNPYVQEHTDLVASLRAGKPLNELKQLAESTLTGIMGRESAYTGQDVTWDQMLNANQRLTPPVIAFGPLGVPPVPMPGRTRIDRVWGAE